MQYVSNFNVHVHAHDHSISLTIVQVFKAVKELGWHNTLSQSVETNKHFLKRSI